ncbi:Myb-like domain [Arabidopsis thaliana x Arabidopsis arenosa]|uniref:Myb-like domain n=1 Tax=Arabidopsis thaliana x Arabidopsis arenosa TaxID=1240361 RepID=A0A8T2AZ79_9BRAS|nr:Myb-like domain [Arabidopsis thaliana x Arabidopsis arenosa]
MATPSPTSSPPSDSNPNSAATPPHHKQQPPSPPPPTNPSSPPQHITVVALAASTSAVARKTQPVLWTHDETLLLIESYKEKWYAIGRGPLKSTHWEEIAVAVSSRSGVERSSTQCRHKIEKMRKRFRSERQSMGPISIWPFYNQMEELDSNPAPISARPLTRLPPNSNNRYVDDDEEEEDNNNYEEEEEEDERQSKSRSINYILRRPGTVNRFAGVGGGLLSWGQKERSSKRKRNDGDGGERRRKGARAVAAEIRAFAERVMVMEKKKIEFVKETVRLRKEMEIRRINLIQSSQTQLLEFINNAFDSF